MNYEQQPAILTTWMEHGEATVTGRLTLLRRTLAGDATQEEVLQLMAEIVPVDNLPTDEDNATRAIERE
jgi:hypothetical protein